MGQKIAIVGEAYGAEEEAQRVPFVGAAGWQLNQMLSEAGIHRADCYLTNVFNLRPPGGNDVTNLCTDKDNGVVGLGPVALGKYIRPEFLPEMDRLRREISELRPNIVIALGNTAAWAIIGSSVYPELEVQLRMEDGSVTNSKKSFPPFIPPQY